MLLDPAQPDGVIPDAALIPLLGEITGPIAEALGAAPVAKRVEPNEWRVGIALRYAEDFIAASGISASQADAISARLRLGV